MRPRILQNYIFLTSLFLIILASQPAQAVVINTSYNLIHTRVLPEGINLIEPAELQSAEQTWKIMLSSTIWNLRFGIQLHQIYQLITGPGTILCRTVLPT